MRRAFTILCLILLLTQFPLTASGWNKPGHMVTGAIAYKELKAIDQQALTRVISLFKQHPWYEDWWAPAIQDLNVNDPDKEGLYLFMYAARWPDDIRDDPDLHCEECHYVNFPFRPGQQDTMQPPPGENIGRAYRRNVNFVQGSSSPEVKARALCWIFHLVGDVHQPLHTSALFTAQYPQGDCGGTRFYIRPRPNASTISLHKLWDGFIIGSDRFNSVNNRATNLRQAWRRSDLTELSETDFSRWATRESFRAAKQVAYRNGSLQGSTSSNNGVVLPPDYVDSAQRIAERRAVVAGYRLADLLSAWF